MNEIMVQTLWVCGTLMGLTMLVIFLAWCFWYPEAKSSEDN